MDGTQTTPLCAVEGLIDLGGIRRNILAGQLSVDAVTRMHKTVWIARYGPLTSHSTESPFHAAWRVLNGAVDLLDSKKDWKWGQG